MPCGVLDSQCIFYDDGYSGDIPTLLGSLSTTLKWTIPFTGIESTRVFAFVAMHTSMLLCIVLIAGK